MRIVRMAPAEPNAEKDLGGCLLRRTAFTDSTRGALCTRARRAGKCAFWNLRPSPQRSDVAKCAINLRRSTP